MSDVVYGNQSETVLREKPKRSAKAKNHVLLGTWLEVVSRDGEWLEVVTAGRGPGGWVHREDVRNRPCFKAFVVDVGQGDGALVEAPNGRLLIDGGPGTGYHAFLRYLYRPTIAQEGGVHFDAVVVSHPDTDHFRGLTTMLKDRKFSFGTIYHNGIIRYDARSAAGQPFDLGRLQAGADGHMLLAETFSTLDQAKALVEGGALMRSFRDFWAAALEAHSDGRLRAARRITSREATLPRFGSSDPDRLRVEVLGPVPTSPSGAIRFSTFADPHNPGSTNPSSSHTRNGHSVVLKLSFGNHAFLFGGDLNIPAEHHLLEHYGDDNPFRVDVAKACHHGSSDFTVEYLKKVRPHANVFSSGDNKSFDHPMADALGAAGRYTRGTHPLLFSTELARAQNSTGTHYGLINMRSNGTTLVMAQMKEQHNRVDVWDSYTVPWKGAFAGAH